MKRIVGIITLIGTLYGNSTTYNIEKSSNSYFKAMADVVFVGSDEIIGINKNVEGFIYLNNNKIENGEIVIHSIGFNTQNDTRDKHIQEILNVTQYPKINFLINKYYQKDNQDYFDGILKINGIEKNVIIPIKIINDDNKINVQGKINIKYEDFNIKTPSMGGFIKKAKEEIEIGGKFVFEKRN